MSSPATSCVIQFAAAAGSAPISSASWKNRHHSGVASCRAAAGFSPSDSYRARRACGSSGSDARISSIHSAPGSTGGRSGSGKYR